MADSRVITKELLGLEDILTGTGTVNQTRNSATVPITKINASNLSYDAVETIKANLDKKATVIENVAAMQAIVTVSGQTEYVFLRGYNISGDSGGGLFWLDTSDTVSTEDLISIFNPDTPANGRWKRIDLSDSMSADRGDASIVLTVGEEVIQRFETVLTANRTITLPTASLFKGLRYRVIYEVASAFTLVVGSVYTFAKGDSGVVEIIYDGTGWIVLDLRTTKPVQYEGDAGGTVDAITAAVGLKAYVDGDVVHLRSLGDNTIAGVTVNFDGLGLKNVKKEGNLALSKGDLGPTDRDLMLKRNDANDTWELVSPIAISGTWTPGLEDPASNAATLSAATGNYTKVGNIVHASCTVVVTSMGSISGPVYIVNLPFTASSNIHPGGGVVTTATGLNITAGHTMTCWINSSNDYIELQLWSTTAGPSYASNLNIVAGSAVKVMVTYTAAP